MTYKIIFDDIRALQVGTQTTLQSWAESISSLNTAMASFINEPNFQGQTATSIRTYLSEVHGTLLQTLVNLIADYSSSLLLYKDGYCNIDSAHHAVLPGQVFTHLQSDLKTSRDDFKSQLELLDTAKANISDLVTYPGNSHTRTVLSYNFLITHLSSLDEAVKQYESHHASQDLTAFKELLSATKALIAEHVGKARHVGAYQSGDLGQLKSIERFATAYQSVATHLANTTDRVQAARERDKARFEALEAEDRANQGWIDLALSVVTIAVGVVAIVASGGSATPLVVGAWIAGSGTVVYGLSNATEAGQDIYLGYQGDSVTAAWNPIRDTLFMGDDKSYHQVGGLFSTASAVMIPIGQTQSVAKGLVEFAIGEVGGFVGGQVGYHGTKLLGASEQDAQRANFVGNLLGGYAVSSAATKFSLNEVDVPKVTSFIDDMSPEDAQRYAAWNDMREAGIDQKVLNDIILTNKGLRPNPSTYLSSEYIDGHLSQFKDGISIIQTDYAFSRFTETNGFVGVPDDNTLFVLPKKYADEIALKSDGDLSVWEDALGFKRGYFSNSGGLVKIDVIDVADVNLRLPDGNEFGANELWQPGGRTYPGYTMEAVTDVIPNELITITRLE